MMKTTIERIDDTTLRLDVEVPESVMQSAVDDVLRHMGREMHIPGFRPGKVPPQAVLARLGREAVVAEAVRSYLDEWYRSAVYASGVRPVAQPEIDMPEGAVGTGPFSFSATVEVAPKPKLPDLATLEVERPNLPELDQYVSQVLEATLRGAGTLEPTGAPAKTGDEVVVDFTCTIDGELSDGASATGYEAQLGDGRLLSELETAIIGVEADAKIDVPVTFPADHPMPQLAGQEAVFHVHVREVQAMQLPELTDEIAQQVSEFDTAAELDADIRASITKRLTGEIDGIYRANAVTALANAADVIEPDALVQSRQQELYSGLKQQLAQSGLTIEQYLDRAGKDTEGLFAELEESARDDLRRELCLLALAEDAGITIDEADLRAEIAEHAEVTGQDVEQTIAQIMQAGRIDMLRGELLMQRTIDHLVASAKPVAVDLPVAPTEAEAKANADAAADADAAGETTGDSGQE